MAHGIPSSRNDRDHDGDDEPRGCVRGHLVDGDGQPLPGHHVVLFAMRLRGEDAIGEARTGHDGSYRVIYARPHALNLQARAWRELPREEERGREDEHARGMRGVPTQPPVATSAILFDAPDDATLDFTSASDGVVRAPCDYLRLVAAVQRQLHGTPLEELVEDAATHELQFLANAAGLAIDEVADLQIARRLAHAHGLQETTFFALFRSGIPAALAAALRSLPDKGIDDAFLARVLAGVLASSDEVLAHALASAVDRGVVPPSTAAGQAAQVHRLSALRVEATGRAPYLRGKTPAADLLSAAGVDARVSARFVAAWSASGGRLGPTWKALRADKSLDKAQLATLNTALSLGELLAGNLPLVKDSLQRLGAGSLPGIAHLALLDAAGWDARLTAIDPQATSIPPVLPDETPAQRIQRFSHTLASRFATRFPSLAFAGALRRNPESSFSAREEIAAVLAAHPRLDLRRTGIDAYLAKNKVTLSARALAELKTAQRLHRLSPHVPSLEALHAAGYQSAQSVYFAGRTNFVARMSQPMGSQPRAEAAWARSQSMYAGALAAFGQYHLSLNGVTTASIASSVPSADALADLPTLQALFGSLDYCECSDCRSVTSPGAYLVDLLEFLKRRAARNGPASAREVLLQRRPDIEYLALGCENTETTLPYIDIVNELLEAAISPPASPVTLVLTTGTSDERRALPQQVNADAYAKTRDAVFPFGLPFDLAFAQTSSFLDRLGGSLADCMASCGTGTDAERAGARLRINPRLSAVIQGTDGHDPWVRWGFATSANPAGVVDPKTRQPVAFADWVAALSSVPVLLARSGLTLDQLYQLLDVQWVTQGGVTLQPGTTGEGDTKIVSCDTELMVFTGLTADVLDRAQRFLRLWRATGLEMWELDALLAPGGQMDAPFLVFLADTLALRDKLSLPVTELLAFWGPMPVRDAVAHLADGDRTVPSTYASVFRDPTVLASWSSVFTDPGALAGTPIVVPADPPPTAAQVANLGAIKAALGLSADDVAAILAATGAANALTLDTLNVLFRHARLSTATQLPVADLLRWIVLADQPAFGTRPADTREFLRRLAVLQATGIVLDDLDYLLRHAAADRSAIAFTDAQASAVLGSLRDGLAKLAPADAGDPSRVQALLVAALANAVHATADTTTTLLARTGALPLPAATTASLLAQVGTVDPALFPSLVSACTAVAKGAALAASLQPTGAELSFVTAQSATFQWQDPGALPLATPAHAPYGAFERLLLALTLNRRQGARGGRLFDVWTSWLAALPADVASAVSAQGGALATALTGSIADVTSLAISLGATAPALSAAGLPGSLCDVARLQSIASALDALAKYHVSAANWLQLAASPPTADSATTAMSVFQARFTPAAWLAAVQPVEDDLRQQRRDALVAYLLGPGPAVPLPVPLLGPDDLYDWYLIDPLMCPCGLTTRLLQGTLAIQQFVQQCFLDLVPDVVVDASVDAGWNEWNWRRQYRLWQANREVFLYPENYLLPELRQDKSPFFASLESDLKQGDCNSSQAEAAFENYLRKLVEVSRLVVAAHYHETRADGTQVLHVFARTSAAPYSWYYRSREDILPGSGVWNAWQPLNLDIASEHVVPVIWDQRLHLLWPLFKRISEKPPASVTVPTSTSGGTAASARTYWSVEFTMSEFSAGQWQAKRTIAQKLFLNIDNDTDSPRAYAFRASQDSAFNLQIEVYYTGQLAGGNVTGTLIANGTLPMPDAPLVVREAMAVWPGASGGAIDTVQEPSYSQVTATLYMGVPGLAMPTSFGPSAQDLVPGTYLSPASGPVPLYVLATPGSKLPPASVQLLAHIPDPRLVIPVQDPVFDSSDPFFVLEPSRSYVVQPHYYTISSSPQELTNLAYVPQWATRYQFQPFYHPFARTFLRELEIGGVDRLMQRSLQIDPQAVRGQGTFDFDASYGAKPPVMTPYPVEDVDFTTTGPYSIYNWELFYHAPMYVAAQLMRNQKYQDAMHWLQYIFDPTDPSPSPVPGHFWRTRPFHEMNANDWLAQQIQQILLGIAANGPSGPPDPALQDWIRHPYDPHRIARLRQGAYAKATLMKFLDNLIAWGDSLFAMYTMENVAQAQQLYVFADLLLGPPPDRVRLPAGDLPQSPDTTTYAAIRDQLDQFSNALVEVENLVSAPKAIVQPQQGGDAPPALPQVVSTSTGDNFFFCIPPNDKLLAYWGTVDDRLYKIRHCLNLQGVAQPLPLYAPPINPLQLVEQAAGGGAGAFGAAAFTPIYRFATYLERAIELANDVRAFGGLVLGALEKKDAEALAALHAGQEIDIQSRTLDLKNQAAAEAQTQVQVLQAQKAVAKVRHDFYANQSFMNDWEGAAITLQAAALVANGVATVLDATAGSAKMIPAMTFGASGFGGSPTVTATISGEQIGSAATSWANVSRGIGGLLSEAGGMASTMGSYQRRMDEWQQQAKVASGEMAQIDVQIAAANQRAAMASSEIALARRQLDNAQAVSDFLTSKFTSEDLYDWMLTQLCALHTQAYQAAYGLAQQAQAAYQYELGSDDTFLQPGYFDGQHKGLVAGESLLLDLRRMQARYLQANARELELTKHVSLALTQPMALVQLLQTGTCQISLDEALFDLDHPGHYFRRLRSVALTVPCVSGPYTGVNATLSLDSAVVRVQAPVAPYKPALAATPPGGPGWVTSIAPATASIATSHGQNDAGLFDANARDERWLPFEGQGAISTWTLQLDPRDNAFDMSTVTDVILHVRYTARSAGGDAQAVRQALKPPTDRRIMLSAGSSFSDAWYAFLHPTDPNATQQTMELALGPEVFPLSNLGRPLIKDLALYLVLAQPAAGGTSIAASFGPDGGASSPLSLVPVPGTTGSGAAIAALGADATPGAPVAPGSWQLVVPEAAIPAALAKSVGGHQRLDPAKIVDLVVVATYRIA